MKIILYILFRAGKAGSICQPQWLWHDVYNPLSSEKELPARYDKGTTYGVLRKK